MSKFENMPIDMDLLISYSQGLLSPAVALRVKQSLERDELLMLEYQGVVEHLDLFPEEHPEDAIIGLTDTQKYSSENDGGKVINISTNKRRSLMIAASLSLLLGFGGLLILNRSSSDLDSLASLPSSQFTTVNSYRGASDRWKQNYDAGKYESVIEELNKKDVLNPEEGFYFGLSKFKINDYESAIVPLKKSSEALFYKSDANFIMACCYTKLKDWDNAIAYCELSEHPKAAELKQKLLKEK